MGTKIAINGFGRIGRLVARTIMNRSDLELVAANDLGDITTSAHLFKYDSVHGAFSQPVAVADNKIVVGDQSFLYLSERAPEKLPWKDLGIDIVIEATGAFRSHEGASRHLQAGAKKVIITAPGKQADLTVVMGVNEKEYDAQKHHIISNASCTTNCLAPVVKVILQNFGIVRGLMTTVHSYTNDQRVLDLAHKDLRRARAAALSMIPTTTGAATAVGLVLPELQGKLNGMALRVPTPNVSIVDLTAELERETTVEELNQAFKQAAAGELQGILKYSEEPLVSSDYNGETHSAVLDADLTMLIDKKLAKVFAWYDNEWAYSLRVADLSAYIAGQGV